MRERSLAKCTRTHQDSSFRRWASMMRCNNLPSRNSAIVSSRFSPRSTLPVINWCTKSYTTLCKKLFHGKSKNRSRMVLTTLRSSNLRLRKSPDGRRICGGPAVVEGEGADSLNCVGSYGGGSADLSVNEAERGSAVVVSGGGGLGGISLGSVNGSRSSPL